MTIIPRSRSFFRLLVLTALVGSVTASASLVRGDGKISPPRDYKGSLEERSQEAIIIFHGSEKPGEAKEDLILKITVAASGDLEKFAWVVPLPNTPETKAEDAALFKELFDYVEARLERHSPAKSAGKDEAKAAVAPSADVEVIKREIVGSYDVAIVKENEKGKLNGWLEAEGYQPLAGGDDVIEFYRTKGYVFACIKVAEAKLTKGAAIDLHPLRFSFKTGGRDGIYFPMKLTGLQTDRFDVNLYVFYRAWLNDRLNSFGYAHRGFSLRHRDWDTAQCISNAGKAYSSPRDDPYLKGQAWRLEKTAAFFQKRYPGAKYYLTNIQARQLKPSDVREWVDDLWLFPHYTDRERVPLDAAPGGPAAGAYRHVGMRHIDGGSSVPDSYRVIDDGGSYRRQDLVKAALMTAGAVGLVVVGMLVVRAMRPKA